MEPLANLYTDKDNGMLVVDFSGFKIAQGKTLHGSLTEECLNKVVQGINSAFLARVRPLVEDVIERIIKSANLGIRDAKVAREIAKEIMEDLNAE